MTTLVTRINTCDQQQEHWEHHMVCSPRNPDSSLCYAWSWTWRKPFNSAGPFCPRDPWLGSKRHHWLCLAGPLLWLQPGHLVLAQRRDGVLWKLGTGAREREGRLWDRMESGSHRGPRRPAVGQPAGHREAQLHLQHLWRWVGQGVSVCGFVLL